MNPNLELEDVIYEVCFAYFGEENELSSELYDSIRDWMSRNQIIFYQP
jgi:hypothetical protein